MHNTFNLIPSLSSFHADQGGDCESLPGSFDVKYQVCKVCGKSGIRCGCIDKRLNRSEAKERKWLK